MQDQSLKLVYLQSSMLPLCYGYPQNFTRKWLSIAALLGYKARVSLSVQDGVSGVDSGCCSIALLFGETDPSQNLYFSMANGRFSEKAVL